MFDVEIKFLSNCFTVIQQRMESITNYMLLIGLINISHSKKETELAKKQSLPLSIDEDVKSR